MRIKRTLCLILSAALVLSTAVVAFAAAPFGPGDVSGDGEITAEDARLCLRQAVGLESFAEESDACRACDVDGEPGVTASDARLILRAAVGLEELHAHEFGPWTPEKDENDALTGKHTRTCATCNEVETEDCAYGEKVFATENQVPTCTEDCEYSETCAVCGAVKVTKENALGHTYEEGDFGVDEDQVCTRCGDVRPCFNTLVNALKSNSHIYTGFTETANQGEVTKEKIWVSAAAKAVAKLAGESLDEKTLLQQLKEEMAGEDHVYGDYVFQREITDNNFYLSGQNIVSALTSEDVKNITVEEMDGVDFIAALPDEIPIKSAYSNATFNVSLAEKIKAAKIEKVLKVTVELKDESYADIKDSEAPTALEKATDLDLREMVEELNQSQNQDGMKFEMKCDEATSRCTVIYYFDAVTLLPIAATYDLTVDSSETMDVEMALDTGIKVGLIKVEGKIMTCNLAFKMKSMSKNYYFFDHYFD